MKGKLGSKAQPLPAYPLSLQQSPQMPQESERVLALQKQVMNGNALIRKDQAALVERIQRHLD